MVKLTTCLDLIWKKCSWFYVKFIYFILKPIFFYLSFDFKVSAVAYFTNPHL